MTADTGASVSQTGWRVSYVQTDKNKERERENQQPCVVHCTQCMSMSMPCDINHKCQVPDGQSL